MKGPYSVRMSLPARWMNSSSRTIDREILKQLRAKLGNRCGEDGYVYSDSIMVTSRGPGVVDNLQQTADIVYDVAYVARVYRPEEGEELRCVIKDKNQEGILCEPSDETLRRTPLDIIMPLRWHTQEQRGQLQNLAVGATITTRVMGARYCSGDRRISVVVEFAPAG